MQFLGIGGKADPARLIFSTPAGPAVNASVIDMGDRFRLLVNVVDTIEQPQPLPKLPVARALWKAQPSLATASEAGFWAAARTIPFSAGRWTWTICDFTARCTASK